MAKDAHISFRLTPELYARLETLRVAMSERAVGVGIDRAKVLRLLVERGLELVEKDFGAGGNHE